MTFALFYRIIESRNEKEFLIMETPNTEMLRGRVDIFVLKAISDSNGYGYDILNYIHDKTEGHYEMKQSSVYSVLKRLEKQGYIYSYSNDESNGAKRRYYGLTDQGKTLLEDQEREWAYTRTLLDNLVSDKSFDLKTDTPPFHPSDLRPMTRRTPKDDFSSENDIVSSVEEEQPPIKAVLSDVSEDESVASQNKNFSEEPIESIVDTMVSDSSVAQEEESQKQQIPSLETGFSDFSDFRFEEDEESRREAMAALYQPKPATPPTVDSSRFASIPVVQTEEKENKPASETDSIAEKGNYRDFYSGLFDDKKAPESPAKSAYSEIDCSHINDLKVRLDEEGIKLKTYDPAISSKSTIKYLLTNKILRDTSVLGYMVLVIMLLIVGLVKSFAVSLPAILVVGGIGLLVPAFSTMICLNNPAKRVKDGLNLSKLVLTSIVVYLTIFILTILINLILPNGQSLNTLPTYAPAIIALFIPCGTAIFILLYKSEKYHLNTR